MLLKVLLNGSTKLKVSVSFNKSQVQTFLLISAKSLTLVLKLLLKVNKLNSVSLKVQKVLTL